MRILKAIILLTGISFLSGCMSQKQPTNKYYVIERPDSLHFSISEQHSSIDGYCEVAPVNIYPAYATPAIAKRKDSNEIIYYSYHHWAVQPGKSMTLLLEDYMNQVSIFDGVSTRFWKINPAFRMETTVFQMETLQEGDDMFVHLSFRFKLTNIPDNKALIIHQADRKEKLQRKNLNLYAKTVGELFHEELRNFAQKIMEQLPVKQETR